MYKRQLGEQVKGGYKSVEIPLLCAHVRNIQIIAGQQLFIFTGGNWLAEQESLGVETADFKKGVCLLLVFHALGNDAQVQPIADADNRGKDIVAFRCVTIQKTHIQLYYVHI